KFQSELQNDRQRPFYITKNFELPVERLYPQSHYLVYREQSGSCIWCRFKNTTEEGKRWCTTCNVPLCLK
ncbi:24303_t:CDS:1, partial [Gigaspora rosea]